MKRIRLIAAVVFVCVLLMLFPVSAADAISAKAYVVFDADSGEVLEARNCELRLPPASTTKIMTALLAIECLPLEQPVSITEAHTAVEGSRMYLRAGETVSVSDLLYGLLLSSGNDAALALAEAATGSVDAFVARMNSRAQELGLRNTHFVNPNGLPTEGHYSSALDLAQLMAVAMRNETFAEICGTREAVVSGRTLANHNRLLHTVSGVDGGKTGYTKAAGRCLVSTAQRNGRRIIVVTLNAPDDWKDHRELYDRGFAQYRLVQLGDSLQPLTVPVVGSDVLQLAVEIPSVSVYLADTELSMLESTVYLPHFCYAPVIRDVELGWVTWTVGKRTIASVSLCAAENAVYGTISE